MEEEELVAEKTVWPWEERLMIMLVLGLFNALGQIQIGFFSAANSLGQQFSLLKGKHWYFWVISFKKVIQTQENYPSSPLAAYGR